LTRAQIVQRASELFADDAAVPPPLTLRGGNAVDGYDEAEPFDISLDEPTDEYVEGYTFWGLGYLDAQSWRHYLPRLIDYAFRRPHDPAMVVEALIRSLRPPDRYPPRLRTLTREQEAVIVEFLEAVAFDGEFDGLQDDARAALEEWWLPGAHGRRNDDEPAAADAAGSAFVRIERALYRLEIPERFSSSGVRDIPEESRTVELWHGAVGGEVPAVVAVNITPLDGRHLRQVVDRAATGLRAASVQPRDVKVPGAGGSYRVDGLTRGDSPAEPQRISIVAARRGDSVVLLSVRSWPRDDVDPLMERVVRSFEIRPAGDGV
jgi:hypothetical protein